MKIGVLGGGSLGLMWTARLCLGGLDPILIVRGEEQKERISQHGLHYYEGERSIVLYPKVITIGEAPPNSLDWLILTVKQTQIDSTLSFIEKLPAMCKILALQNGYGHLEKLEGVFTEPLLFIGITTDGAMRLELNQVERTGSGTTWIGHERESVMPLSVKETFSILQQKGFQLDWAPDILFRVWKKLLINSVINPLTAILGIRNGELLHSPQLLGIMQDLFTEGRKIAQWEGLEINEETWQEIIDVCRNTSKNHSSMLQDLLAKRSTEIDYINGYLISRGEAHGYSPTSHKLMVQLVRGKEEVMLRRY